MLHLFKITKNYLILKITACIALCFMVVYGGSLVFTDVLPNDQSETDMLAADTPKEILVERTYKLPSNVYQIKFS